MTRLTLGAQPLHPDTAAEIIIKSTHLLLTVTNGVANGATGGGRGGWVVPGGQREAMSMAVVHVLMACRLLLRHISEQVGDGLTGGIS